jgi:hypothetical protein
MYELEPRDPGTRWFVAAGTVQPLMGETVTVMFNVFTGEEKPVEPAEAAA